MPIRDTLKGGWHPGKDSGSGKGVSARSDFKGVNQLAGWMGKGKADLREAEAARSHSSAPLSSLKDPASFGPPPRHAGKREVQSPTRTGTGVSAQPKSYASVGQVAFPESQVLKTAPSGGLGTPLPASTLAEQQAQQQQEYQEEEEPEPEPPQPYRANTTGLSTAGLPAPPARRDQPLEEAAAAPPPRHAASRPVPKPPPRLPPRQTENVDEYTPAPPPPYSPTAPAQSPVTTGQGPGPGYLNKSSLNRLGQAGVSVPGFGIGGQSPQQSTTSPQPQQPAAPTTSNQLSELQQRLNRMPGRVSSPTTQPSQEGTASAGGGTTWAQKQAALSTANKFHKDPSSVSMSDARSAGSTLNNFRQRHGEQVAQGYQQAQGLDKKYGVSSRVGGLAQGQQQPQPPQAQASYQSPTVETTGSSEVTAANAAGKKRPPPPPKKKPTLASTGSEDEPPPVPMSSRPRP